MIFVQPLVLFVLLPTLLSGKKVDPKNYTQTATVVSVSSESKESGAAIREDFDPCSAVAPIRREECESQRQASKTVTTKSGSFVRIKGELNNMEYSAVGRCFLQPGTYKVLVDGLEMRFLTSGKGGKPGECQFRITKEERQKPTDRSGSPGARTTSKEPSSLATTATLNETLQWLTGASEEESGDGNTHIISESNGEDNCAVTITETRVKAGPDFWIKESFSLADIDPDDVQVEMLGQGQFKELFQGQSSVRFHTTNYRKMITSSSKGPFYPGGKVLDKTEETLTSDYTVFTNDWFAPRFAKAFKHAVELCGGRKSTF